MGGGEMKTFIGMSGILGVFSLIFGLGYNVGGLMGGFIIVGLIVFIIACGCAIAYWLED